MMDRLGAQAPDNKLPLLTNKSHSLCALKTRPPNHHVRITVSPVSSKKFQNLQNFPANFRNFCKIKHLCIQKKLPDSAMLLPSLPGRLYIHLPEAGINPDMPRL